MVSKPIHLQKKWRTTWSDGPQWGLVAAFSDEAAAHEGIARLRRARCLIGSALRIVDSSNKQVLWEGRLDAPPFPTTP